MRASATAFLGPGWFSDVAVVGGTGYLIGGFDVPGRASVGLRIVAWTGDDLSRFTPVFSASLIEGYGYARLYAAAGTLWAAWHDGRVGHLRDVLGGTETVLDPCEGSSPIAFGGGAVAWQGLGMTGYPVTLQPLDSTRRHQMRLGAPTGLSRIDATWNIHTIDEDRLSLPGATQPAYAGDLAVGEREGGGVLWRLGTETGVLWTGFAGTPRCAVEGELVAITAGGGDGIRLFCGSRAELLETRSQPVDPKPKPKPDPEPKPKPKPEPEPPMQLPARAQQIVQALYERHLPLANGDDDQRRELAKLIAEQTRFELGDAWGWKSNHGIGNAGAKDAIAKRRGPFTPNQRQLLWIFDLFNGATRKPNNPAFSVPDEESAQFFWPVDPVNHLGAPEPDPDPEPEPKPNGALAGRVTVLEQAIGGLGRHLAVLTARVEALEQRPIGGTLPADVARKGDPVTAAGVIDLGFRKIPIVGHGTIDR